MLSREYNLRHIWGIHSTALYNSKDNNLWSAQKTVCLHLNLKYFEDELSILSLAEVPCNVLTKGCLSCFLSAKDISSKQLTQASGVVVVLSGTEAVPAFADGLQGSISPRTVVGATQTFLLGDSWFGCGCGYWWRWGRGCCGSHFGCCESKPLNLKERDNLLSCSWL